MKKEIVLNGQKISYEFTYKAVKNINLRVRQDGSVSVSAPRYVPFSEVEHFLCLKADLILSALERFSNRKMPELVQYRTEQELREMITAFCKQIYPYYENKGIPYPQIKFRRMTSQWGNCCAKKGTVTLNTNLIYAPSACVFYVVWHEFTHLIEQNHAKSFYAELERVCPEWKQYRNQLKTIILKK